MTGKVYRYDLNGARLTTEDLLDGVGAAIGQGCSCLLLANVLGPNDVLYSFVLQPVLISPGPVTSLLELPGEIEGAK